MSKAKIKKEVRKDIEESMAKFLEIDNCTIKFGTFNGYKCVSAYKNNRIIYTYNLTNNNPTKNSPNQENLTLEIIDKIDYYSNI